MLRVGIAGIGFMGMIHFLAYRKVPGVKVVALSSRNAKRLAGDWRDIQGNFGPPGERMDLAGIAQYPQFAEMLADPKIDLIDICLPPALHADATIAAVRAGKHVLCEKPIALSLSEGQRMIAAAQRARKQFLVGHVLPFAPEFAFAYQAIRDGRYGKLLGAQFKRTISDPAWLPDFYEPDKVGGPLLDLLIHDAHFIRLACGMPRAVASLGRMRGKVVEFVQSQFQFDDSELVVSAVGGVIRQQGRAFTHAFEIQLERATLLYDFAVLDGAATTIMPLTVLDERGKVQHPRFGAGDPLDGFVAELRETARAIRTGEPSPILGSELACDALRLCQKQAQAVASGRIVKI